MRLQAILALALFLSFAYAEQWTMDGNSVYWTANSYTIRTTPATSYSYTGWHQQEVDFISDNQNSLSVNMSFVFPVHILSGKAELWQNVGHPYESPIMGRLNATASILVSGYAPSTLNYCDIGDMDNALKYAVNATNGTTLIACFDSFTNVSNNYTLIYSYNGIVGYQTLTNYYYEWVDISNIFSYYSYGQYDIFTINDVQFNQGTYYKVRITFKVPQGENGKYDIYIHTNSPQSIINGQGGTILLHLDPWYGASPYAKRMFINCSNVDTGVQIAINGSEGFTIAGSAQQIVWTKCRPNLYLFFNDVNASDYIVANDTEQFPFEVEQGSGTSFNATDVWRTSEGGIPLVLSAYHATNTSSSNSIDMGFSNNTLDALGGASIVNDNFLGQSMSSAEDAGDSVFRWMGTPSGYMSGNFRLTTIALIKPCATNGNGNYFVDIGRISSGNRLMASYYTTLSRGLMWENGGIANYGVGGATVASSEGNWWQFFASTSAGYKVMWLNTTKYNQTTSGTFAMTFDSYPHIALLAAVDSSGGTGTASWCGNMTEFRTYNGTLLETQINQIYYNAFNTAGYGTLGAEEEICSEPIKNITKCQQITCANTTYYLTENVTDPSSDCISVKNNNITLDCQGFSINSDGGKGLLINMQNDTTVRNCVINSTIDNAFEAIEANNLLVEFNTIDYFAIDAPSQNPTVRYNIIPNGMDCYASCQIYQNSIAYLSASGEISYNNLTEPSPLSDSYWHNNNIVGDGSTAIYIEEATNINLTYNIVNANTESGITFDGGTDLTDIYIYNNTFTIGDAAINVQLEEGLDVYGEFINNTIISDLWLFSGYNQLANLVMDKDGVGNNWNLANGTPAYGFCNISKSFVGWASVGSDLPFDNTKSCLNISMSSAIYGYDGDNDTYANPSVQTPGDTFSIYINYTLPAVFTGKNFTWVVKYGGETRTFDTTYPQVEACRANPIRFKVSLEFDDLEDFYARAYCYDAGWQQIDEIDMGNAVVPPEEFAIYEEAIYWNSTLDDYETSGCYQETATQAESCGAEGTGGYATDGLWEDFLYSQLWQAGSEDNHPWAGYGGHYACVGDYKCRFVEGAAGADECDPEGGAMVCSPGHDVPPTYGVPDPHITGSVSMLGFMNEITGGIFGIGIIIALGIIIFMSLFDRGYEEALLASGAFSTLICILCSFLGIVSPLWIVLFLLITCVAIIVNVRKRAGLG